MSNVLIEGRNRFLVDNPVQLRRFESRKWGFIRAGSSGPALVLIPGTLGKAEIFWQQMEALAGQARILSVTYPDSYDLEEWSQDLERLMDDAGFETATVLGSSLGGYFAQYFAATRPQRCQMLIAANTLSSTAFAKAVPPYSLDLANAPIDTLRKGFADGMSASVKADPSVADLVGMLLEDVNGGIPESNLRSRLMAIKYAPPLPDPVLPPEQFCTIEAADDPLIPPPIRDEVRSFTRAARCYRFLNGGHFPYVVRPDSYTMILEECLGLREPAGEQLPAQVREL